MVMSYRRGAGFYACAIRRRVGDLGRRTNAINLRRWTEHWFAVLTCNDLYETLSLAKAL